MNANDYIKEVDSLPFSEDLESRIIYAAKNAPPRKKRRFMRFVPICAAASLILVVTAALCVSHFSYGGDALNNSDAYVEANGAEYAYDSIALFDVGPAAGSSQYTQKNVSREIPLADFDAPAESAAYSYSDDEYMLLLSQDGTYLSNDAYTIVYNELESQDYNVHLCEFDSGVPVIFITLSDAQYQYFMVSDELEASFILIEK